MKILMVCLGNICRSPLAHGILEQKAKAQGLNWEVDSAGTGSWHAGELPDKRSIQVAKANGLNILDQRARQIKPADLEKFDHVLVMDSSNFQDVKALAKTADQEAKIELIMNFADPGRNQSVPDPYWNDNGFQQVFSMLSRACEAFIGKQNP